MSHYLISINNLKLYGWLVSCGDLNNTTTVFRVLHFGTFKQHNHGSFSSFIHAHFQRLKLCAGLPDGSSVAGSSKHPKEAPNY